MTRWILGAAGVLAVVAGGCRSERPAPPTEAPATQAAATVSLDWPGFRGPRGDGVAAPDARPSLPTDAGIPVAWKTPVPAPGHSSPIVAAGLVMLTGEGHRILAFDAATGELRWDTALDAGPEPAPAEGQEAFAPGAYGIAVATPCTDGRCVYAMFADGVLGAVGLDGRQAWAVRVVDHPANIYGMAASPLVHDGIVIQAIDLDAEETTDTAFRSFLVGLRAEDGTELWRTDRPTYPAWATPLLTTEGERGEVITCAEPWVIAYDPADGKELWRAGGARGEIAASPIADGAHLYAFGDPNGAILAIRRGGTGDITDTHIAWQVDMDVPEVPSGIADGQRVLFIDPMGVVRAVSAADGESLWRYDHGTTVYASPVLAAQTLLVIDTDGELLALDAATG
ncbi:MAG: PQQ-binding-like beta-propeller repeat protein, partial [Planctomycetes bacterium]|nr:PQQ-binding-like beta-propeller repeat protein [Planctomycetota bacterium]